MCREERGTDKSADKCRLRYRVFRQHYPALTRLQALMPFSVIDATGSLEECEAQIAHELRYQSSLDLDERTYAAVARIPLAREVVQHSRQHLVQRLDEYQLSHTETFHKVRPGTDAAWVLRNGVGGVMWGLAWRWLLLQGRARECVCVCVEAQLLQRSRCVSGAAKAAGVQCTPEMLGGCIPTLARVAG